MFIINNRYIISILRGFIDFCKSSAPQSGVKKRAAKLNPKPASSSYNIGRALADIGLTEIHKILPDSAQTEKLRQRDSKYIFSIIISKLT